MSAWLCGSALVSINWATLRRARLILGWVTVCAGKPSWYNQPPRSTQPFILPGSINEYRQYAGGRRENHLCRVAGNTVWSHMTSGITMRYTNRPILYFTLHTVISVRPTGKAGTSYPPIPTAMRYLYCTLIYVDLTPQIVVDLTIWSRSRSKTYSILRIDHGPSTDTGSVSDHTTP